MNEFFGLSERLLSGALTGLYHGLALALIVRLTLRLLRRTNAATRHGIWFATLMLVTALMIGNCLTAVFSAHTAPPEPPTQAKLALNAALLPSDAEPAQPPDDFDWGHSAPQGRPAPADAASQESFGIEIPTASTSLPNPQTSSGIPAQPFSERIASLFGLRTAWQTFLSAGIPYPISWRPLAGLGLPLYLAAVILGLYVCVACARMFFLAWHFYQLRRLKQTAATPSNALLFLFSELCRGLAVRRRVTVKTSAAIRSPVLLGFLNPVVLVPQPEPGEDELSKTRQVLCHELAHVRRRDDWLNLLQHCVEATMFFHPIVWWISKRLALEREIACDDLVLNQGGRPRAYALLLAELAGRLNGHRALIAPGFSASHSQLNQRINMILNTNRNISPCLAGSRAGLITSAAALLALGAFYCAPRLVLAQDAPVAPAPPVAAVPPVPAVAPAPPVSPAPAPVAIAGDPPAPPSADESEGGPRFKSQDARPFGLAVPAPPAARMTPFGPVVACTPNVSVTTSAGTTRAHAASALAMAGSANSSENSSIEERVERLEKMVRSLTAQQKNKGSSGETWSWATPAPGHPSFNLQFEHSQAQREQAQMERDMARAQEQMKRATEEMERAGKNHELFAKDMPRKQLEALRKAREGLQKQLESLDRQIERLEQEREQPKEPKEPKETKEGGRSRSGALLDKPAQNAVAIETH